MTTLSRNHGILLGGLLGVLLALPASAPAPAATLGLVVGIDQYRYKPPLKGAVNDARDIQAALTAVGVKDIVLLLNEQASRQAIEAAWKRQVAKAKPGDTLIFTYAGHGGQEPERAPGSEADGKDEALLLSGFREIRPGNGQRIVDDDLNRWFRDASALNIIFVADACYSGTLTRSIDPRAAFLGSRTIGDYGPIQDDELPPPAVATAGRPPLDAQLLPNVTFLAASRENEITPEFVIEGRPRGALSWAFAQALRGAADANRDRKLTREELRGYVDETVRMYAEFRQHPKFEPLDDTDRAILPAAERPADRWPAPPTLRVRVLGLEETARQALLAPASGMAFATAEQTPDLIWDAGQQQVLSGAGDIVAYTVTDAQALQSVVAKWRMLATLKAMSAPHALRLRLEPNDSLHRAGTVVSATLDGHRHGFLTLFNLAANGTVQFLYPLPQDPKTVPIDRPFTLKQIQVTTPYGADHVVAVVTPKELATFHTQLRGLDDQPKAEALGRILREAHWGTYQMGVLGTYTAPNDGS
ncbi:MAG TPA: caspase family protein [Candidatus Competibacter sp.]|nr:caspase family protein [Candidatus Competibacter sp.]HRX62877.1 caspase family protein [Candidatus Competibacter sp.]